MTVLVLGFQWIFWKENGAQEIFRETLAAFGGAWGDGFFAAVDVSRSRRGNHPKARFLIYQAKLPFDFRPEGGGFGARFQFTNCLLIPTRKTPTGSGQRALAFGSSGQKTVFDPSAKFLGRRPQLHRIRRVSPLHHHTLTEIAAQRPICFAQPLVKRQRIRM